MKVQGQGLGTSGIGAMNFHRMGLKLLVSAQWRIQVLSLAAGFD